MLFNTGSIAGSIFINTSEEVALTDRGIELLDSQGNILEVFNSNSTNWSLQPAGLPQVGIRLDPQSKIKENQTLELKVYEDSLADSAGNNLVSATNLSIPIINAESAVINLE